MHLRLTTACAAYGQCYTTPMQILSGRALSVLLAGSAIVVVLALIYQLTQPTTPTHTTATVSVGTVEELVSVSGVVDALQQADLGFPIGGTIATINVATGDTVPAGAVLATLRRDTLLADRAAAAAALAQAEAAQAELLAGPTATTRAASNEQVRLARAALETTRETQAQAVANAYQKLLSSDLTAISPDSDEEANPPTVSGTYTCHTPGTYELSVYPSDTSSGYSYRLSGLETGTYPVSVTQAAPLGQCGLRIQFSPTANYNQSTWQIALPNPNGASYLINQNAYQLARTQASTSIRLAEQELALALANAQETTAPARREAITQAQASVAQAAAQLARTEALLAERTLTAPFAGTITRVDSEPGETVSTAPFITLLTDARFEVTARIPEIDIGKLALEQPVRMVFDARDDETLTGKIRFVSPEATLIDGVAYYEAIIVLDTTPSWLRSGLNADIDIIIDRAADVTRIPRRFLIETTEGYAVRTLHNDTVATSSVTLVLEGNDGYVAIDGLPAGSVVVAP